jgi:hypothetical protein
MIFKWIFYISIIGVLFAYQRKTTITPPENSHSNIKNYLFLGHTYQKKYILDKRLIQAKNEINYFNQLWLGGDIALDAGIYTHLLFLDSILKISDPKCHWAFGNHDLTNAGRESICNFTKKKPYYAFYNQGITVVVYETNYYVEQHPEMEQQTNFINMICDTISASSHLILIGHHAPWGKQNHINTANIANASIEDFIMKPSTNEKFDKAIYPNLVQVQQKNIQVLVLAGDFGQKQSTFEYQTPEGMYFLGNGILSEDPYNSKFKKYGINDSVLIFRHQPSLKKLSWHFINIGD